MEILELFIKYRFCFFFVILLTPILIVLNIAILKIFASIPRISVEQFESISKITMVILTISISVSSVIASLRLLQERKRKQQQEIAEKEIKELDNAIKLFNDSYFSQSILESFKVIETHLIRELTKRDFRVPHNNFMEIVKMAIRIDIINNDDVKKLMI